MPTPRITVADIRTFEASFDLSYEATALAARGAFLRTFPRSRLGRLSIDDYVIGKGTASFCAFVEAKSRAWAAIQGATSRKFGIYFGKTKSDPLKTYRFTQKFGTNANQAFESVKSSLLALVRAGERGDFQVIDANPLSQMFKAKILSLYFPDLYLNVCSAEHLARLAAEFDLPAGKPVSEYQHLLLGVKSAAPSTRNWSNPKFMSLLYRRYIYKDLDVPKRVKERRSGPRAARRVNFEDINADRDRIGKISEDYALAWEMDRLLGLQLADCASRIKDMRDRPAHGYDFESFEQDGSPRFIEVKSLGLDRKELTHRFFLSANERDVSTRVDRKRSYYFYLVQYGSDGNPIAVRVERADRLYSISELDPCAYIVRLKLPGFKY